MINRDDKEDPQFIKVTGKSREQYSSGLLIAEIILRLEREAKAVLGAGMP